jgi:cytochrome bd-type quinol oxidase subunit 2
MTQAGPWVSYSSFAAITPSSTTSLNCRAIYVPPQTTATTVVVATKVGGTLVTFTVGISTMPTILPIELDQGIVDASSTATGLVSLQ